MWYNIQDILKGLRNDTVGTRRQQRNKQGFYDKTTTTKTAGIPTVYGFIKF